MNPALKKLICNPNGINWNETTMQERIYLHELVSIKWAEVTYDLNYGYIVTLTTSGYAEVFDTLL
jgi:hypothetical protein